MTAYKNSRAIDAGATPTSLWKGKGQAAQSPRSAAAQSQTVTLECGQELTVTVAKSIDDICDEWLTLQQQDLATPFQKYAWVEAWQNNIGKTLSCRAMPVLVSDRNGAQMILPLGIMPMLGGTCLTWLGHDLNDYCAPLISRSLLAALTMTDVRRIMRLVRTAAARDGANFAYLPKQPATLGGQPNPFSQDRSFAFSSMSHSAHIGGSWTDYFNRRRGKSTRRRIAQKSRKLEAAGDVAFSCITDNEDLLATIRTTLEWKQAQLNDRVSRNLLSRDEVQSFFADLVENTRTTDQFCGYRLSLDGTAIATAFGFISRGSFLLYQTAYAPDADSKCSPGLLLLTRMMEDCADRGLDVFDFSLGDEGYKFQWSDENLELTTSCYPLTVRGVMHAQLLKQGSALKRFLKSKESTISAINSAIKYCRSWF